MHGGERAVRRAEREANSVGHGVITVACEVNEVEGEVRIGVCQVN